MTDDDTMTEPTAEDTSTSVDTGAGNTPQDKGSTPPASTGSTSAFRSAILDQMNKWSGAVEGSALFTQFMSADSLTEQRKAAGKAGIVFTTCIAFQQRVLTDAAASQPDLKVKTNIIGTLAESRAKNIPDAWHDGAIGMTDRPTPGDIYLLAFANNAGMFSHIGYIKSITVNADGTETWTTVDGGQGTAGKYDADGNVTQTGQEKIAESNRTYDPTTNLIKGEANQGGALRLLKGWVDIDKLAE